MLQVLGGVWALLFGMALIMIGNGMQATLMGVRGGIEGFSSAELSIVTAGYFLGFLSGAQLAPRLIRSVGHVRVFAALGSFMSAALIAFPLIADPWAWTLLRIALGFSMSGVYVTAESWLNNAATNEMRGKLLSAYMLAQMAGMIAAQWLVTVADAAGPALFIGASILVSLSFAPILLSAVPLPAAELTKPMSLRRLYEGSPLGTVGVFLLGGVFAAQFGMASVYGAQARLSVDEIALFVAMIFVGSAVFQFPVGWLSDRMDRRVLILGLAAIGAAAGALGYLSDAALAPLLVAAFVMGGMANPLYSLFIAYTNDFLETEDMPAASGGLVFTYGLGAIAGPLVTGAAMEAGGAESFWLVLLALFAAIAAYAAWRMTRRPAVPVDETGAYVGVMPTSSPVALEAAQEWSQELAEQEEAAAESGAP
ncbi:MFS transporter [Rhodosalinus halophilus]|uniref:MFS transporter n=1 Tax=Rhodosalinus halophilus TaxID=2259333 RepID=A0A365U9C0_9RHOB|nr:MFS transporter [Rhodosalinus halophilus]RBI85466.1 MFS transporter [Rhodosalinus halophilus]